MTGKDKQQELKPIPKWAIYSASGAVVTVGMLVIKGICTGINFAVEHVLAYIGGDI